MCWVDQQEGVYAILSFPDLIYFFSNLFGEVVQFCIDIFPALQRDDDQICMPDAQVNIFFQKFPVCG